MSDNTAIIRQTYSKNRVTGKKVPTYPITCIDALVGRNGQSYKDELKEFVADTIDEQGLGAVNIADSIPEAGGSATKLLPANTNAYVLKIGGVNYQAHSVVFGDGDPFLAFCFMHTTEGKGKGYVLFELADTTHWKYKAYYEEDDVPEELLKVFNEDLRSTISNLGLKVGNFTSASHAAVAPSVEALESGKQDKLSYYSENQENEVAKIEADTIKVLTPSGKLLLDEGAMLSDGAEENYVKVGGLGVDVHGDAFKYNNKDVATMQDLIETTFQIGDVIYTDKVPAPDEEGVIYIEDGHGEFDEETETIYIY